MVSLTLLTLMATSPSPPTRRKRTFFVVGFSVVGVTSHAHVHPSITTVRRESLAPGTSPAMEHKIWKDVTRRLSTVGVKRSRRSSAMGILDDEARPRKRQARKSLSGLTKAEVRLAHRCPSAE